MAFYSLSYRFNNMKNSLLIVLTGTSGSGKTTLCSRFLTEFKQARRVITTTTRKPRAGETNGVDYYFEDKEHFLQKISSEGFFEYALVYENYYGVSRNAILGVNSRNDLIICLDVQGAKTLQAKWCSTVGRRLITVFVSPETLQELHHRLKMRDTDDEQTIQKRLRTAEKELETLSQFDYHLCSRDKEHDWQCLQHIYFAEKMRV